MIGVLLTLVGLTFVVVGVGLLNLPAALIVLGVAFAAFGLLADLDREKEGDG